jgi:hypothetical protein
MSLRRRCGGDRGAVLVILGLALVALLGTVAIVVDLGQLRASRRANQTAADLAALAAGYHLSGRGTDPLKPSPRAACAGAINSAQTNLADFRPALDAAARTNACAGFPDSTFDGCSPAPAPVVIDRGPYRLTITYPVSSSAIAEPRFTHGVGATDGSNPCERMAVLLRRTDPSFFAGVFGVRSQEISAQTVVRANTSALVDGVAALLLLERMGCGVLQTSGGGSTGSGAVVQASGSTNPGVIQADSAGQVGSGLCTTNENADGYVIYGTALPNGGPSIQVQPAANGAPGIVAIRSIEVGGRGGAVVPTGLSPAPVGSGVNSRQVADNRYNRPVSAGGHAQISTLHAAGRALVTSTSAPAGYDTITGARCSNLDTATDTAFAASTHLFVACPDFAPTLAVFPAATHTVFTGKVSLGNGDLLSLPAARRVYVRGCPTCSGGGRYSIDVAGSGELRVNTLASGTGPDLLCSARPGPGAEPAGTFTAWAALATYGGPFLVSGQVRMCQTAVYLGRNDAAYARQSVEASNVGSPSYPPIAECSPLRPCPSDAGGDSFIRVSGGSGSIDWSAPNQLTAPPTLADFATYPFEDLALWSEASVGSEIKGQGANRTEGVFFLPNSSVTFTGQATQAQPLNAQFVARRLNISGQGSLFLRPSKDDAIPTRIPGAVSLIR